MAKKVAKTKEPKAKKQNLKEKWAAKKLGESDSKEKPAPKPEAKKETALAKNTQPVEIMLSVAEAKALEEGMKADLLASERSIIAFAKKLDKFVRGEGWKVLADKEGKPYKGLTEWREAEMPFSEYYNARAVMKLLRAGVSADQVDKMQLTNINTMVRQLPPSQWKEEKILAAAEGPIASFGRQATKLSNEIGMNVEEQLSRSISGPKSLIDNWDLSLRIAGTIDGCKDFESKIEAIVSTYLNSNSEIPGKTRLQLYQENYEQEKAS